MSNVIDDWNEIGVTGKNLFKKPSLMSAADAMPSKSDTWTKETSRNLINVVELTTKGSLGCCGHEQDDDDRQ
jgi:hypothetical protein